MVWNMYLHSISVHLGYAKFQGGWCHLKQNFGESTLLHLHFSWMFGGCKPISHTIHGTIVYLPT